MKVCGKVSIVCEYKQKFTVVDFKSSQARCCECPWIEDMQGDEASTKNRCHQSDTR